MADLISAAARSRREADLTEAMRGLLELQIPTWEHYDKDDFAAALAPLMLFYLRPTYQFAAQRTIKAYSPDQSIQIADKWPERYAKRFAKDLATRIGGDLRDLSRQIHRGDLVLDAETPEADIGVALGKIFGEDRADNIGITETTKALSAGQIDARDRIYNDTGLQMTAIWHTERDKRVCPICDPLDGTEEAVWTSKFPDGPPSPHPRCRCWLTFEEIGAFSGTGRWK